MHIKAPARVVGSKVNHIKLIESLNLTQKLLGGAGVA